MEKQENEKRTLVEAIIFLKEKGFINDNDIQNVIERKMTIYNLSQKAVKVYYERELYKLENFVQSNPPYELGQFFNFLDLV